jgi:hypothetical protein
MVREINSTSWKTRRQKRTGRPVFRGREVYRPLVIAASELSFCKESIKLDRNSGFDFLLILLPFAVANSARWAVDLIGLRSTVGRIASICSVFGCFLEAKCLSVTVTSLRIRARVLVQPRSENSLVGFGPTSDRHRTGLSTLGDLSVDGRVVRLAVFYASQC